MHGQDGNHISLTLDGMPLNDTGNYAIYTNQMLDPEVIDRVSANQGATDVDSPTAAATGGVIAIVSDKPHDEFGAEAAMSRSAPSASSAISRASTAARSARGAPQAFARCPTRTTTSSRARATSVRSRATSRSIRTSGSLGWFSLAGHWNSQPQQLVSTAKIMCQTRAASPSSLASARPTSSKIRTATAISPIPPGRARPRFNGTGASAITRRAAPTTARGSNSNSGAINAAPKSGHDRLYDDDLQ